MSPTVGSLLSDDNVINALKCIQKDPKDFFHEHDEDDSVMYDTEVICSMKQEEIVECTPSPQGVSQRKCIVSRKQMQQVFSSPISKKGKTSVLHMETSDNGLGIVKALDFNSPLPKPVTTPNRPAPDKDSEMNFEHLRQIAPVKDDIKNANAFLKYQKAPKHA